MNFKAQVFNSPVASESAQFSTSLKGWITFRPNGKRKADVCSTSAFFVLSRYPATTCVDVRGGGFSVVSES